MMLLCEPLDLRSSPEILTLLVFDSSIQYTPFYMPLQVVEEDS